MNGRPIERLRRLPFFSSEDYLALNPDIAGRGIDPAEHALNNGFGEGRPAFHRVALARAWGGSEAGAVGRRWGGAAAGGRPAGVALPARASVMVSTGSDPSEAAIGHALVDMLGASGLDASLVDETADPDGDHGLTVVVAPHTFFVHGLGHLWAARGVVERSIVLNTAPLHRPAFSQALPWILRARGLLEVSPQLARMFDAAGVPSLTIGPPLGVRTRWLEGRDSDHPLIQALPRAARSPTFDAEAWDDRPLDLAFFDINTARRAAILRRHAAALAHRPSFVYAVQSGRDCIDESLERRAHFRIAGHVSAHARATLFLAEDEFPHLDWFRCAAQAMASGSVVVTDLCPPHPDFVAGEHLFQDDVRHVGELIRWLLDDEDGRAAGRAARRCAFALLSRAPDGFLSDLRAFLSTAADPDPT